MSDVQDEARHPTTPKDRRTQLLSRLQQISQTKQASTYGPVAQMLLDEIEPVQLVSALLSQLATTPQTTPIATGAPQRRERRPDVARMA